MEAVSCIELGKNGLTLREDSRDGFCLNDKDALEVLKASDNPPILPIVWSVRPARGLFGIFEKNRGRVEMMARELKCKAGGIRSSLDEGHGQITCWTYLEFAK